MKDDGVFDIQKFAEIFNLSQAEAKCALNIPLDEECSAATTEEAKKTFEKFSHVDDERKMAAFKRWSELFIMDIEKADSLEVAIAMIKACPIDSIAIAALFQKIADFCGVTPENHFKSKVADLKTVEEIVTCAFKFMPLKSDFISPSGKLRLSRNSIPNGHPMVAKVIIENDRKILYGASWGANDSEPKMEPKNGVKSEEIMEMWRN